LISEAALRRVCAYIAVQTGFGYAEILNMDLEELDAWANAVQAVQTPIGRQAHGCPIALWLSTHR